MAKSNYYTPSPEAVKLAPGVKYQQWSTRIDAYTGDAESLVKSGVVQEHMFPAPGRCAISWRALGAKQPGQSVHREPGYMTIRRTPTGNGFRVDVVVSREEQQLRQEGAARERSQSAQERNRATEAVKGAQEALRELPKSHQEFRDKFAEHLYTFLVAGRAAVADCLAGSGYSLDQTTWIAFLEEFCEALGTITSGRSSYEPAKRTAHVAELQAKIVAHDVEFRPFLTKVLQPLGSLDRGR